MEDKRVNGLLLIVENQARQIKELQAEMKKLVEHSKQQRSDIVKLQQAVRK